MNRIIISHYPLALESLPSLWATTTVGDAMRDIQPGFASGVHNQEGLGIPHLRPMNVDREGKLDLSVVKYVSPENPLRIRAGEVLFNNTNSAELIGKTAYIGIEGELAFSNHMTRLRPATGVDPRFVAYQLHFLWMAGYFLHRCTHHVNQASISSGTLAETVPLVVAPSLEQVRVVAEIEKQFTRLDVAVGALKRVRANLKRYRAAVLKAACEGLLVPTEAELAQREGRSYEPASMLLDRILVERRASWEIGQFGAGRGARGIQRMRKYEEPFMVGTSGLPNLPEGWSWASLDSLLREPLRNGHSAKTINGADGIPTFSLSAVTDGDFSSSNIKNTSADPNKVDDLWVEPGDIFIERSNTPELVGTARLYTGEPHVAIFPDLLIRVRLLSDVVPAYIEAVLQSHRTRQFYRKRAQGISGTMPKINQNTIQETMIPLPPRAEQELIMEALAAQISVTEHLENELHGKLAKAEALRQSTLKSAFLGKLLPQHPSDEAASILLSRISSESSSGILAATVVPKREGDLPSMSRNKEKRRRSIVEVLKSAKSGMSPEALLSATGHEADSIDEFYAELKTEVESGLVEEVRSGDKIAIRSLQK